MSIFHENQNIIVTGVRSLKVTGDMQAVFLAREENKSPFKTDQYYRFYYRVIEKLVTMIVTGGDSHADMTFAERVSLQITNIDQPIDINLENRSRLKTVFRTILDVLDVGHISQ